MAENLNYNAAGSVNNRQYGMLYTWETARGACPSGWHLPTRAEWDTLIQGVGGYCIAGKRLRSKTGWRRYNAWGEDVGGTDDYGFSELTRGNFWSATEDGEDEAYSKQIFYGRNAVYEEARVKEYAFSVRCVKD